jgi:hypothetical protein
VSLHSLGIEEEPKLPTGAWPKQLGLASSALTECKPR